MSVLEAIDVRAGYGRGEDVLRGVTVRLAPGLTALVGPNGAGKSTLLRTLLGVLPVRAGRVELDGSPLSGLRPSERSRRIAAIAQRPEVSAPFTVERVVELGRFSRGPDQAAVRRALETVSLWERRRDRFGELSAGQQQRVSLARALAQLDGVEGGVLLADEPVSSMDPTHALDAMAAIRRFADAGGAALVSVQDLTVAARFADRGVAIGRDGTIALDGPTEQTLTPERLGEVFGTPFERLDGAGGPAIVAWSGNRAYRETHGQ